MAKTRRTKQNRSPIKPYKNAKAFVAVAGEVEKANKDAKPIFVNRQYTGVARSKPYPYRSAKRGGTDAPVPRGLIARAAKAVKTVLVKDV